MSREQQKFVVRRTECRCGSEWATAKSPSVKRPTVFQGAWTTFYTLSGENMLVNKLWICAVVTVTVQKVNVKSLAYIQRSTVARNGQKQGMLRLLVFSFRFFFGWMKFENNLCKVHHALIWCVHSVMELKVYILIAVDICCNVKVLHLILCQLFHFFGVQ